VFTGCDPKHARTSSRFTVGDRGGTKPGVITSEQFGGWDSWANVYACLNQRIKASRSRTGSQFSASKDSGT
jgi:hypothetical protein